MVRLEVPFPILRKKKSTSFHKTRKTKASQIKLKIVSAISRPLAAERSSARSSHSIVRLARACPSELCRVLTACGDAAKGGVYKDITLGGVCWASSYSILSAQVGISFRRQMSL
jgi:hypothetical protein